MRTKQSVIGATALGLVAMAGMVHAQATVEQNRRSLGARVQTQDGIETEVDPRAGKRLETRLNTRLRTRIDPLHGTQNDYATSYTPKLETQTKKAH